MGLPNALFMFKMTNAGMCGEWDDDTITIRSDKGTKEVLAIAA
jgi:hypothetical protein